MRSILTALVLVIALSSAAYTHEVPEVKEGRWMIDVRNCSNRELDYVYNTDFKFFGDYLHVTQYGSRVYMVIDEIGVPLIGIAEGDGVHFDEQVIKIRELELLVLILKKTGRPQPFTWSFTMAYQETGVRSPRVPTYCKGYIKYLGEFEGEQERE